MSKSKNAVVTTGVFDPAQLIKALPLAVRKLDPRHMARNPVMFVVTVGSVATTVLAVLHPSIFAWAITAWLWFTVVFANLAEAVAEGRGKAQAASLREVSATPSPADWSGTVAAMRTRKKSWQRCGRVTASW